MKMYDKRCPQCGHINRNLYLEETEGWMECEKCGRLSRAGYTEKRFIPAICSVYAAAKAGSMGQMR